MEMVRQRSDATRAEGFTIVEVVMAMTVVAIGIVGVIGVMHGSFDLVVANGDRSKAVGLATREIEALRAVPYEDLAVSPSTVTRQDTVGGVPFTVERGVTWARQGANDFAYKRGVVSVSWNDVGGAHSVHQETLYYPGGLAPGATTTTTAACGPDPQPPIALLGVPAQLSGATGVDLAWTPAVGGGAVQSWIIESSTNNFATKQVLTTTQPPTSTSYLAEGLSAGVAYQFRVSAVGLCAKVSAWSPVASVTTTVLAAVSCQLQTPNLTPAKIKLANNGANAGLSATPVLTVNTTGSCTGLKASYTKRAAAAATVTLLSTSVGGVWTADLTTSGPWDVGVKSVDILDSTNSTLGTVLMTVCAKNASSC
jgi:hypothetical protein